MKPIIAVSPLYDDRLDSYWMLPDYMKALERFGAITLMLPMDASPETLDYFSKTCDALLLTGGHDVSPELYGEAPKPECGHPCKIRDSLECGLIDRMLRLDKPILGICRGIQILNAHLGGTLFEDLPSEHPSPIEHHMKPPYDRRVHFVELEEGSRVREIVGNARYAVNSYHHQAVKRLSPELCATAISEDGIVEAVEMPGKRFVLAVQWHPEFLYRKDPASSRIFEEFVRAAAESRKSSPG